MGSLGPPVVIHYVAQGTSPALLLLDSSLRTERVLELGRNSLWVELWDFPALLGTPI